MPHEPCRCRQFGRPAFDRVRVGGDETDETAFEKFIAGALHATPKASHNAPRRDLRHGTDLNQSREAPGIIGNDSIPLRVCNDRRDADQRQLVKDSFRTLRYVGRGKFDQKAGGAIQAG